MRTIKKADTREKRRGIRKVLNDLARDPIGADGVEWVEAKIDGEGEAYRWKEAPLSGFGSSEES